MAPTNVTENALFQTEEERIYSNKIERNKIGFFYIK